MLQPNQIRAARAAIDWSADDLAKACGLSRKTIQRIESSIDPYSASAATITSIQACLEAQGIEFITSPDGSPGIVIRTGAPKSP